MQINCVCPAISTLIPLDIHLDNTRISSYSNTYLSCLPPAVEAGRIYFRSGKWIIHWSPKTGIIGSIQGHALPVKSVAVGNGCIYSADDSSILCWNSSTHIKLTEISVKNITRIWVYGDILLTMGLQSIRSYKLSKTTLSFLHELSLPPWITIGTIISLGVLLKQNLYSYFLVVQTRDDQEIDNNLCIWTIKEPFEHSTNKEQTPLTIDTIFPQFTAHVERTNLPLLTNHELASARDKCIQHLSIQADPVIRDQSEPVVELFRNTSLSASSRQLPGIRGHTIIDIKVLTSNHILCICTDVLYLYNYDWSIVNRKCLLDDTISASYVHISNNYLVVAHVSGYVSIYDGISFTSITTFDLRQYVRINGAILTVALLELDGFPNIVIVFKIGAIFLSDIVSRSIVPCLGLCTRSPLIVPFRELCLAISGTTTLGIVAIQTIFNRELHLNVPKSFVLESSFHGPCLDFIVDLYYQHYVCIVTDTHLILLEAIISRSNESGFNKTNVNFKQILQCATKKLMFDSINYQSGCFVAGPSIPPHNHSSQSVLTLDRSENLPLWLCLLTNKELHLLSIPTLDTIASYTFSLNIDQYNRMTSFLACDRGVTYGDYLLLSGCYQKSVTVLSTIAEFPYIRLSGTYPLALISVSPVAIHPSSMYAIIVHNTGISLYTLPDFNLLSTTAYIRANKGEHTVYFDPLGAYFLVSTLSQKYNISTLTIYEFGTGVVHSSLDFDGEIKQIVFTSDTHAFLSDDNGNIYELLYDNIMTLVIHNMEHYIKGLNGSITQLWASMNDVKWN